MILIKLQGNFIEAKLRLWHSFVNMLYIFRTLFPWNTSGGLILNQGPFQTFVMELFYKNSSNDSKPISIFANIPIIDICQIPKNTSETATRGVPEKNVFVEISQNSQESTCARVSF